MFTGGRETAFGVEGVGSGSMGPVGEGIMEEPERRLELLSGHWSLVLGW